MAVNIHNLIAAIVPDVYCKNDIYTDKDGKQMSRVEAVKKAIEEEKKKIIAGVENAVQEGIKKKELDLAHAGASLSSEEKTALEKKLRKEAQERAPKIDYVKIAGIAERKDYEPIDFVSTFYKGHFQAFKGLLKNPLEYHSLSYDSPGETLEPLYFWIVDSIPNLGFTKVEKISDSFASTVGSGHFSEMGAKASRMQEEAMKIFGTVNTVLKSILNIVYDLKEFKIRLETYDELKSKNENIRTAAMYSLKQIWMDSVDAKRGTTSLKGLAQNFDYVTLIDAFMFAKNLDEVHNLDLNDRVKRILEQRYADFDKWIKESEIELRKRYEVERIYLKSQYNSIKLYARWLKPYLEAAGKLEQRADMNNPALVSMFNSTIFELSVIASSKYDPDDDVRSQDLPKIFKGSNKKKYAPVMVFDFKFRSIPEKFGQNYAFRGRADIIFSGYALKEDEVKLLKEQLAKSDVGDLMSWVLGSTDNSLLQIQSDIDSLLPEEKPTAKGDPKSEPNPFTELADIFQNPFSSSPGSEKKWEDSLTPSKDDEKDKVIRSRCILTARMRCTKFYEIYKKAHKMQAFGAIEDAF